MRDDEINQKLEEMAQRDEEQQRLDTRNAESLEEAARNMREGGNNG